MNLFDTYSFRHYVIFWATGSPPPQVRMGPYAYVIPVGRLADFLIQIIRDGDHTSRAFSSFSLIQIIGVGDCTWRAFRRFVCDTKARGFGFKGALYCVCARVKFLIKLSITYVSDLIEIQRPTFWAVALRQSEFPLTLCLKYSSFLR